MKKMASSAGSDDGLVARGAAVACFVLGTCCRLGKALPQDSGLAEKYYKQVRV